MGLLPDTQNCGLRMLWECRERFPRHRLQREPLVSDPDMHHGTCVRHVPWCMSGSLTRGGGKNVPGIPGATPNFAYLVRGPWKLWLLFAEVWVSLSELSRYHSSRGWFRWVIISCDVDCISLSYPPFPLLSYFSVVVCLRCLLHHILSLIAYTFQENREFVFIIIVQFMMSANSRIPFGLQIVFVCLYSTPSHYHHCANLSEDIELIKCLSDISVECVSKIEHILSVIHYTMCGAVCFQFIHFLYDDWENIYTLSYYHHQIGSMNYYPLFRVRSWNNGVRCMSFYILMDVVCISVTTAGGICRIRIYLSVHNPNTYPSCDKSFDNMYSHNPVCMEKSDNVRSDCIYLIANIS